MSHLALSGGVFDRYFPFFVFPHRTHQNKKTKQKTMGRKSKQATLAHAASQAKVNQKKAAEIAAGKEKDRKDKRRERVEQKKAETLGAEKQAKLHGALQPQ